MCLTFDRVRIGRPEPVSKIASATLKDLKHSFNNDEPALLKELVQKKVKDANSAAFLNKQLS